ncbi:MAG: SHOCT domain-containing protein [Nitrospirae bacterium]|nr:SHOCT domain-containing protein [Nitrospirota bacterium]
MANTTCLEKGWMFHRSLLIAALITTMAGTGCAATKTLSRPILDDRYNSVRLEAWLDSSRNPVNLGFEHPAEIGEADLAKILGSIRIVEPPGFLSMFLLKAKPEAEPAFTSPEAEFLAKPLAAALRTATPGERVVFFLHHQRSVYKGTTSSGVAFVKDKRLHIILGRYLMGNQPGYADISIGGAPLPDRNDQTFYILPGRFQAVEDQKKAPGGREPVFEKRWLSIDYASLLNAPPQAAAPASSSPSEPLRAEPAPAAPSITLEEKLKTLNRLKEEGLITEEEYNEKRKELLKSF